MQAIAASGANSLQNGPFLPDYGSSGDGATGSMVAPENHALNRSMQILYGIFMRRSGVAYDRKSPGRWDALGLSVAKPDRNHLHVTALQRRELPGNQRLSGASSFSDVWQHHAGGHPIRKGVLQDAKPVARLCPQAFPRRDPGRPSSRATAVAVAGRRGPGAVLPERHPCGRGGESGSGPARVSRPRFPRLHQDAASPSVARSGVGADCHPGSSAGPSSFRQTRKV